MELVEGLEGDKLEDELFMDSADEAEWTEEDENCQVL